MGTPSPFKIFTVPMVIVGLPEPRNEMCGLEAFDVGGVPPEIDAPGRLTVVALIVVALIV